MDVALIADRVTVATEQGLGFANSLLHRHNLISSINLALSNSSAGVLPISAAIFDAIAPPPVKRNASRTARLTLLRKKRKTRRRSGSDGDGNEGGEEFGFFGGEGGGSFGGAGGSWGGGGKGWNFGGFGGQNWDEPSWSWSASSGFAYGFVCEVIYWIALSNCVHFAFKKIVRRMADGIADAEREKVPMPLASVC